MKRISIPFIQLKECFLKDINLKALEETNIDEAVQLLESFIPLSWKEFFSLEPKINKDKKIEEDKGCVSYIIRLDFEGDTHQKCPEILEKCAELANKVEVILKPFKQRIRVNILCDSCKEFDKQNKKTITTAISERMIFIDFLAIEVNNKREIILPAEYYFEELKDINFLIKNIQLIAEKFEWSLEELISAIRELLIAYGAMNADCNMCTSYRLYEVLNIFTRKLKMKWEDLEPFFNRKILPEFLKEKSLKNIVEKNLRKRMNKPLSELSTEERHARIETTKPGEEIPPLTSKQVCQIMKELLKAFLKKIRKILEEKNSTKA